MTIDVPQDAPLKWRKSSRSSDTANCVEVAELSKGIAVRDSKNPDGPTLSFHTKSWRDFIADVQRGKFDRPLE